MAKIHIALVSAQAAPNLLPALDPSMKPDEVVLLVSQKMQSRAEAQSRVLRESSIKVSQLSIENEHDFPALEKTLLDLAASRDGEEIALNVTGGTKLMALAAQSVAQAAGWEVFYIDVDTDEAIWLGQSARRQKLATQLRLRHYLQGYGFTLEQGIERPPPEPRHDSLRHTLLKQIGSLEGAIGQLNYLGQQAEDKKTLSISLSPSQQDSRSLEALLRNFEDADVLTVHGNKLVFKSAKDLTFAKGGWLEYHAYRTVEALHGPLDLRDKAVNLFVTDPQGVKNELDICFLARNRLFVIECKTARMDSERPGKANDTLFKLAENCRRIGGLGTQGMLLSYRALGDSEKKLAKALNVTVVVGSELNTLEQRIRSWVNGRP